MRNGSGRVSGRGTVINVVGWLLGLLGPGCGGQGPTLDTFPTDPAPPVSGPAWWGFGRDSQHSAVGAIAALDLEQIRWHEHIDLAPPYSGGELFIHYGSPVITDQNTVVVPVKTSSTGTFRIEARSGGNGALIWTDHTDYRPPSDAWMPALALTLSATGRLYAPAAGGRVLLHDTPSIGPGVLRSASFYGDDAYARATALFNATVVIDTPITVDTNDNAFFGFIVSGANPAGLTSGIARLGADGTGSWVDAGVAAGDPSMNKVAIGSAPALSMDQGTLYLVVNADAAPGAGVQPGQLLALDSHTLAPLARAALVDPETGMPARVDDVSTASPLVGPDGDVYFGVLASDGSGHHSRGWLLHFDAGLAVAKTPGSFGWDDTPSVVPASLVASYGGSSAYLIMSKYNNYGGGGGDGKNLIAILDPNATQPDAYGGGVAVMKEILTILGPTPDPAFGGGVKEWCINSAAVDPFTHSVLVNSEDGVLYRWDLASNQLSQSIRLSSGLGQAYTPTAIGADGAVFAISNAILFVVGK